MGELEDAVLGTARLGTSDVLSDLAARSDIDEVRSIGFGMFAVSGTTAAPTTVAPGTTAPLTAAEEASIDDWADSLLRTPERLTLGPPATDAAIGHIPVSRWVGKLCEQPVCPGWVLER